MTAAQSSSLVSHIIERNVQMLMSEFDIALDEAFSFVYRSSTFDLLNDELTGLRAQSPDYIYEILKEEFLSKNVPLPTSNSSRLTSTNLTSTVAGP